MYPYNHVTLDSNKAPIRMTNESEAVPAPALNSVNVWSMATLAPPENIKRNVYKIHIFLVFHKS